MLEPRQAAAAAEWAVPRTNGVGPQLASAQQPLALNLHQLAPRGVRAVRAADQAGGHDQTISRWLRAAHSNGDVLQPIMHPFSIRAKGAFGELPSLMQDLASFLLTRGCTLTAC